MDLFNLKLLKESAGSAHIEAFQFDEDATIVEALTEADAILADMSADIEINHTGAAEIVMEAYIAGNPNVVPISELSLKGIGKSVKEFFEKMVAMVKGIIEKIKQRFALSTKNRSEFVSRFNAALAKRSDKTGKDFTYTGYKWNKEFLTKMDGEAVIDLAKTFSDPLETAAKELKNIKRTMGPDGLVKQMKALKDELGTIKSKKYYYNSFAIEMQGNNNEFGAKLAREARGGSEKVTMKLSDIGISTMITYIENSKSEAEKLVEAYNTIKSSYQDLADAYDELDKVEFDANYLYDKEGNKTENSTLPAEKAKIVEAQKYFKEVVTMSKDAANYGLSTINKIVKVQQSVSEQATREFMSVLKSFALSKDKK